MGSLCRVTVQGHSQGHCPGLPPSGSLTQALSSTVAPTLESDVTYLSLYFGGISLFCCPALWGLVCRNEMKNVLDREQVEQEEKAVGDSMLGAFGEADRNV